VDHGHKGYAFALLVEALTGGLAGHGRADPKEGWGATVFVQVMDPACFGGAEEFRRQTGQVAKVLLPIPGRNALICCCNASPSSCCQPAGSGVHQGRLRLFAESRLYFDPM